MNIQFTNCINFFDKKILQELNPICKTWVAGGCVRDYFSVGYITSDIDLYFDSEEEFRKCYIYFLTLNYDTFEKRAHLLFENDNVVKIIYKKQKYDLVKKFFTDPKDCIDAFDFTVCCGAVDSTTVYHHETFFIDLSKKQLMINALPFPMSTMWRMQKYIQKGFGICTEEMTKLATAISALEIHKPFDQQPQSGQEAFETGGYGGRGFRSID